MGRAVVATYLFGQRERAKGLTPCLHPPEIGAADDGSKRGWDVSQPLR
jgi:hypothetical protein